MKKVSFLLIGLLIFATLLTGCGSKIDNPSEGRSPGEETNSRVPDEEDYISDVETKYVVIDPQKEVTDKEEWDVVDSIVLETVEDSYKITYLKENHPEVEKVKKVTEEFLKAALNIDYKTYTGQEILPYFTQRRLEEEKQKNLTEQRKKEAIKTEIISKMIGIKDFTAYFDKNFTKCRIDVLPIVRFTSAKEGYLGEGVVLNKDYLQVTTLWLKKENDIWKVEALNFVGLKPEE